jgi:hypothetical protein
MNYQAIEAMLLGWPGVELSRSYGRPSLKVNGKFFTWVKEDGDSIVIGGVDFDERETLMETQGDVFYITEHYRNSRYVLMRLSRADPSTVTAYLRRRWFQIAPRKLHAAFGDATNTTTKAAKRIGSQEPVKSASLAPSAMQARRPPAWSRVVCRDR